MQNQIIHTEVNPDFFENNNIRNLERFFKFLGVYKKALISSIQDPDMDDEIILISAEGYMEEIFIASSEETKKIMIEICNGYLDYNISEHRAWIFVSHLINSENTED